MTCNKIILVLMLIGLSACENVPMWRYDIFKGPQGADLSKYDPMYLHGWRDGCESGADASATHFYRVVRYKFKQDWQLLDNNFYVRGWEDAYNLCRKYILQNNLDKIESGG